MDYFYDLPDCLQDKIIEMKEQIELQEQIEREELLERQQINAYNSFVSAWYDSDSSEEQFSPPTFEEWERL